MQTIIALICTISIIIADVVDWRSNKRVLKNLKEAKKALDDNTRLTKEYQAIIEVKLDALDKKTTSQDNYLWKSIIILAQRMGESNHVR